MLEGVQYSIYDLADIPLDTSGLGIKKTDYLVKFSGRLSPYSNFSPYGFTLDDVKYTCVEQHYQSARAKFLGDQSTAMEIMCEKDPVTMKHKGDAVKDPGNKWKTKARDVMYHGTHAKFSQSPDLMALMDATGDRTFVECNIYDRI